MAFLAERSDRMLFPTPADGATVGISPPGLAWLPDEDAADYRGGATLDVRLACPAGLRLSQTDAFDTPYNAGIPEQFHENRANHWHVTAETDAKAESPRIGVAIGVYGPGEAFELTVFDHNGWLGARARGDFGEVEGWLQLVNGASGPDGFGDRVVKGGAKLCGRDRDGDVFAR